MADFPHVALKVNADGRGTLTVNGVELQVSTVRIEVDPQHGSRLRFEMLAHIECEIAPNAIGLVDVRPVRP